MDLSDGGVFFIFALFGPMWGLVFWVAYPYLLSPFPGVLVYPHVIDMIAA